jgi:type VII secretion protein EccB
VSRTPPAGPAPAPATRDQADAYRFGLRRLEAALVRGDPVPLHEQVRSQRRAAVAGVVLGLLALGAVAGYAKIVPRPDWRAQSVVLGSASGALYVVAGGERLVPVANLPAARLVLAALRTGGATGADPATAAPVVVADADLDTAPRTAAADVPGAAAVRLDGAVVPPAWAVCDEAGERGPRTVVVGGAVPPAGSAGAALLAASDGGTWLVHEGRRHRVDPDDRPALLALGLTGQVPRAASTALLDALAEAAPLRTPRVPGAGTRAPAGVPGAIGDVLVGEGVGGVRHWVVLAGGVQEVPDALAGALRGAGAAAHEVGPDVLAAAREVPAGDPTALDATGWPSGAVPALGPAEAPVVCWTWSAGADPAGSTLVAAGLPVPPGAPVVPLAQDGGEAADAVVLAPAGGGAVRATGPGRTPGAGPLWLVSATGTAYGVADDATAAALGVTAAEPAPEAALRLLPVGGALDVHRAVRTVDVLPAG